MGHSNPADRAMVRRIAAPSRCREDTSIVPRRKPRALFGNIGLMAAHS